MDTVQVLFALFIELLKICTGNNIEEKHNRPLSPLMRAEVQKLDKYIEEYSNPSTERGRLLRKTICDKFNFSSLEFQSLEGIIQAIGIDPCKLCTYCWSGKE